jgi:hypothetical protein
MQRQTFRHLGREWEAVVPQADADPLPVRFRDSEGRAPETYEARVAREELEGVGPGERELALRRGLESALVLDALARAERGLTAEEVADRVGMPVEAAVDRLHVLETVQPVPETGGPTRYRRLAADPGGAGPADGE